MLPPRASLLRIPIGLLARGGGCDGENGLVGGAYGSWRGCSALVGTGMYGKDESEEGGLKNENRRAKN